MDRRPPFVQGNKAPPTSITMRPLLASVAALSLLVACSPSDEPSVSADDGAAGAASAEGARMRIEGSCMGTSWSCVLELEAGQSAERALELAQEVLEGVDRDLSTWKRESDLSRFNRAGAGESVDVSPTTVAVLDLARTLHRETGAAFDPTVAPLVELWGFAAKENPEPPSDEAIEAARATIGFDEVSWTAEGALSKSRAGIQLDASAIAKGYAVDLAADALTEAGFGAFLLEVGGEVVTRGTKADGAPWNVGIEDPRVPEDPEQRALAALTGRPALARLQLTGRAVATSGDYRNVREVDGRIVAHAIDPRTGRPIDHAVGSVTVVAADCGTADALATAALVLGAEKGLALLERLEGVEGLVLERDPAAADGLRWLTTSGFEELGFQRRED